MNTLDYYLKVGILIGSRAFGGPISAKTDYDLIVLAKDIPTDIPVTNGNYIELADGVIDMFYTTTKEGATINIQVVKDQIMFVRFYKAKTIMDQAGKVYEKNKRINQWRLCLALAGVQEYKPWPKPSFMTKLKGLFK